MKQSDNTQLSIPARLITTAFAGLGGFGAAGMAMLFIGPISNWGEVALIMGLFTAAYVPGVFGSRWLLRTYASESADLLAPHAHAA